MLCNSSSFVLHIYTVSFAYIKLKTDTLLLNWSTLLSSGIVLNMQMKFNVTR